MDETDTIVAIASASGGASRGIVRLSGPDAAACLQGFFSPASFLSLPATSSPRRIRGLLRLPQPLGDVPCDLLFWPGLRSYTRQPVAELHLLGSPPVLEAVVSEACRKGARLARPGEFTLRAFLAGRLDLAQAEAVLGVIDAQDRRQLQVALRQLAGGMGRELQSLRQRLLELLAEVEAGLDFAEEEIDQPPADRVVAELAAAEAGTARLAAQLAARALQSGPLRVVIAGWPNVGKSSLLNALCGESAALVSAIAGTTRDYVERPARIGGLGCQLIDTAGVEAAQAGIGAAAQFAMQEQRMQAHVELFCVDGTRRLEPGERQALRESPPGSRILVLTKSDQPRAAELPLPAVATSSWTGEGLDLLRSRIHTELLASLGAEGAVAGTAARCADSLQRALASLQQSLLAARRGAGEEIVAAELRAALDELGVVAGAVVTDDILDRVFSRFCIGK